MTSEVQFWDGQIWELMIALGLVIVLGLGDDDDP